MTNKAVKEFAQLNEAYQVLERFYLQDSEEDSLLDQLDSAVYAAYGGGQGMKPVDAEYNEVSDLIDKLRDKIGDAMNKSIKLANQKIKEVA